MSDADREELETLLTERDALRGEVERLRRERVPMCVPTAEGFRRVGGRRLLAAAQSLHRAWKRERSELARLRAFVAALRSEGLDIDDPTTAPVWTGKIHAPDGRLLFDLSTVGDPPSESALLDKLREVTAGLHASTGIPYSALCHYQDRPHCAGCPDDATCEASGREPRKP